MCAPSREMVRARGEYFARQAAAADPLFGQPESAHHAVAFALDKLEPFEVAMFLEDWRHGSWWDDYLTYVVRQSVEAGPK